MLRSKRSGVLECDILGHGSKFGKLIYTKVNKRRPTTTRPHFMSMWKKNITGLYCSKG